MNELHLNCSLLPSRDFRFRHMLLLLNSLSVINYILGHWSFDLLTCKRCDSFQCQGREHLFLRISYGTLFAIITYYCSLCMSFTVPNQSVNYSHINPCSRRPITIAYGASGYKILYHQCHRPSIC